MGVHLKRPGGDRHRGCRDWEPADLLGIWSEVSCALAGSPAWWTNDMATLTYVMQFLKPSFRGAFTFGAPYWI